jgi:hypothetical protein
LPGVTWPAGGPGAAAHLPGMTTIASAAQTAEPLSTSREPRLAIKGGARLALASRAAQGFPAQVADPEVLAGLRGLCAAPRPPRGRRRQW